MIEAAKRFHVFNDARSTMTEQEKCFECGGEVEAEVVGDFKDWVCQDCGIIVDCEMVVEEQEEYIDEDVEVME